MDCEFLLRSYIKYCNYELFKDLMTLANALIFYFYIFAFFVILVYAYGLLITLNARFDLLKTRVRSDLASIVFFGV